MNLPPFWVVVAVLNLMGRGLSASRIPNAWIPFLLCACGPVVLGLLKGFTEDYAIMGVSAGLTAVGSNQALRQGIQIFSKESQPPSETPPKNETNP